MSGFWRQWDNKHLEPPTKQWNLLSIDKKLHSNTVSLGWETCQKRWLLTGIADAFPEAKNTLLSL